MSYVQGQRRSDTFRSERHSRLAVDTPSRPGEFIRWDGKAERHCCDSLCNQGRDCPRYPATEETGVLWVWFLIGGCMGMWAVGGWLLWGGL